MGTSLDNVKERRAVALINQTDASAYYFLPARLLGLIF